MFVIGQEYRRREIHEKYGGNWQGGITPSSSNPFIFIFTGGSGKHHGYRDQWENEDIFSYTGEGQVGDMEFTRGNLQLRDQLETGKRVFLFQSTRKAYVKFIDELEIINYDYFDTHDRNGDLRRGIKFFFKRAGAQLYLPNEAVSIQKVAENRPDYSFIQPDKTERKGLVTSRVGQGAYRKSILHRWNYKCAATGYDNTKILIASHIVPWKDSTDEQRLDVNNGILLSPNFDALFDKHMISFDEKGLIILTDKVRSSKYKKLGVTGGEQILSLTEENQNYLESHRSKLA